MNPKFARIVFRIAAIYGLLVSIPQFFMLTQFGQDNPPALNHTEFYFGFFGLVVVFQLFFLVLATDPVKYRAFFPIAWLEKLSFGLVIVGLLASGTEVPQPILLGAVIDQVLLVLFVIAWLRTPRQ